MSEVCQQVYFVVEKAFQLLQQLSQQSQSLTDSQALNLLWSNNQDLMFLVQIISIWSDTFDCIIEKLFWKASPEAHMVFYQIISN